MNIFTDKYNELIGKTFIEYRVPQTNFSYYRFFPRVSDLDLVNRLSKEKIKFEMNASQNIEERNTTKKLEKTFEGTLAELAILQFLTVIYHINHQYIKWYNIERNSFEYSPEEYDIRLDDRIDIGVRSSHFKESDDISRVFFTDKMDYFLYQNEIKKQDKKDNFQMRVLYLDVVNPNYIPKSVAQLISALNNDKMQIYIVGGIKCSEIITRGQYKNMGQYNSQYHTLNLKSGPNLTKFYFELMETLYGIN